MRRTEQELAFRDKERIDRLSELTREMYRITGASDLTEPENSELEIFIEKVFTAGEIHGYEDGVADSPDGW